MFNPNKAIEDIAKGLDELFTSDEERLKHKEKLLKLHSEIYKLQVGLSHELIRRNTEVAKKSWMGRWPEMLAIAGIVMLIIDIPLRALLASFGVHFHDIDESMIIKMLMQLLGVG